MNFLEAAAARAADASSAAATAPLPPASGEAHEEKLKDASYAYWHDKVPSGAPKPEHKPIAVEAGCGDIPTVSIDNFGLMDDDDIVKVYVKLEGDLEGLTADAVEFKVEQAKYDPTCSMLLLARGKTKMHRLRALPGLEPWLSDSHPLNPTTGVRIPVRQTPRSCGTTWSRTAASSGSPQRTRSSSSR
jgi:hypothetical protein